jgi:carboxymethylenebutenolidase
MLNSAHFLKGHALSKEKLGVTGFCWGGSTTNYIATALGADMRVRAPYYGAAADTAAVPAIKASLLIHYAENDERIDSLWPAYDTALKAANIPHEVHIYLGTQHGFHNNSTPRYQEAAAKLSWERAVVFFKRRWPNRLRPKSNRRTTSNGRPRT